MPRDAAPEKLCTYSGPAQGLVGTRKTPRPLLEPVVLQEPLALLSLVLLGTVVLRRWRCGSLSAALRRAGQPRVAGACRAAVLRDAGERMCQCACVEAGAVILRVVVPLSVVVRAPS